MILIDSNVWIGAFNENDEHHDRAVRDLSRIIQSDEQLVVSDYVAIEVLNVLFKKAGKGACKKFIQSLQGDTRIDLSFTGRDVFFSSAKSFSESRGRLSIVDTSLAMLSKRLGATLLTYDDELKKAVRV